MKTPVMVFAAAMVMCVTSVSFGEGEKKKEGDSGKARAFTINMKGVT